jgi:hypothetical protein
VHGSCKPAHLLLGILPADRYRSLEKSRVPPFSAFRVMLVALFFSFDIVRADMLARHQQEIQADRDLKLEAAREQRKKRRQRAA